MRKVKYNCEGDCKKSFVASLDIEGNPPKAVFCPNCKGPASFEYKALLEEDETPNYSLCYPDKAYINKKATEEARETMKLVEGDDFFTKKLKFKTLFIEFVKEAKKAKLPILKEV